MTRQATTSSIPSSPRRRRRREPRAATVPLRRVLPSLLTTLSLCGGLAGLHFALKGDFDRAVFALVFAGIFDLLDGAAARLLRATTRFGAVLDSLSDFLSFGVAPAVILHQWMLKDAGALGIAATMGLALCSALRLARFTAARRTPAGSPMSRFFVGLPTPAAAAIVLAPVLLESSRHVAWRAPEWAVATLALGVAWLMVSRQPTFSLKKLRVPRRLVFPLLVGVGVVALLSAKDPALALAIIAGCYVLSIPLSILLARRLRRAAVALPVDSAVTPHLG